jgi:hypothetical protein
MGLIQLAVLGTSLNYWKHPRLDSWQRKLDMVCVAGAVSCQLVSAVGAKYQNVYYLFVALGVKSYFYSKFLSSRQRWWESVYFHSLMHALINIGVLALYSGPVPLGH